MRRPLPVVALVVAFTSNVAAGDCTGQRDYEKGAGSITRLRWDDAKQMLTPHGAAGWSEPDSKIVKIAGH
jgi:hypothetical protein